jgi:hypothetical protein
MKNIVEISTQNWQRDEDMSKELTGWESMGAGDAKTV